MRTALVPVLIAVALIAACRSPQPGQSAAPPAASRHSILLVTLDTTRADSIGPEAGVSTPAFNALAARGRRYTQAYATAPETLPSHASMMTGLYPAGHGIHENARFLSAAHPVAAEKLRDAGYRTAAFVSAFVLAHRFGLARGFETYDDELARGASERDAAATTDRAIAYLAQVSQAPFFLWVHYFDPHAPYAPPPEFRTPDGTSLYLGEIAAMDQQLGRLVTAFDNAVARSNGRSAIVVAGDHGEGLGDHGEATHGNLLYQSTMHVPLVIVGANVQPGTSPRAVSTRRVFHTLLDLGGVDATGSLRDDRQEIVLGEGMKPFLSYGWQPQIMAVSEGRKAIFSGRTETYDLGADPREQRDLGSGASIPGDMRKALDDYPVPSIDASRSPETLSEDARRSLASLGYVSGGATPVVRKDAPRPVDMAGLFETIDRASALFVLERYADAIPLFKTVLARDPNNLDAALRLATSYSILRQDAPALDAFRRAAAIAPRSDDVRLYLALHYARGQGWTRAVADLERIAAATPDRVAALEGLAIVRERQGRLQEAVDLRQKIHSLRPASPGELVALGEMAMAAERTDAAIAAFEQARRLQGTGFQHDLELGVLYLAARRLPEARDALDRVPPAHPGYPMALFKRAQVSVLLNEPDRAERIARARQRADATTRELIAREKIFQGVR